MKVKKKGRRGVIVICDALYTSRIPMYGYTNVVFKTFSKSLTYKNNDF